MAISDARDVRLVLALHLVRHRSHLFDSDLFSGMFLFGLLIYRFIVKKVMRGPILAQMVVTFGVSIFISNLAVYFWTPDFRLLPATILHGTWHIGGLDLSVPEVLRLPSGA